MPHPLTSDHEVPCPRNRSFQRPTASGRNQTPAGIFWKDGRETVSVENCTQPQTRMLFLQSALNKWTSRTDSRHRMCLQGEQISIKCRIIFSFHQSYPSSVGLNDNLQRQLILTVLVIGANPCATGPPSLPLPPKTHTGNWKREESKKRRR